MEGDQGPVEAAGVVGAGRGFDVRLVEHRSLVRVDFGLEARADEANEFDGHGRDLHRRDEMSGKG